MNKSIKWYTKSGTDKTKASILFGGDICPAGRPEESMLAGQAIFDDYIQSEIERSDLFIVNLEAPLCIKELRANNPSGFGLRADGNVAEWLKNTGVDIAGIANNHLRDFLDEGVVQTMENLDRAGIEHVGGGKTLAEAEEMLITEVNGLKVRAMDAGGKRT